MLRLISREVRHGRGRAVATVGGILVAAVSFSLLTAATTTQTAQVTGTVQSSLRAAYDILVRPNGSETAFQQRQGLVQDNYLSGIFGGITMAQYERVKAIPGVEVAAPIAMIGYILETVVIPIDVTSLLKGSAEVLTLTDARVADRGLTRFPAQAIGYVYVTQDPLKSNVPSVIPATPGSTIGVAETLPDGATVSVCASYVQAPNLTSPFTDYQATVPNCFSLANGFGLSTGGQADVYLRITIPFLVAAIDPEAEQQLVGLGNSMVKGRYLTESDSPVVTTGPSQYHFAPHAGVPVLATSDPYVDDEDNITVSRLPTSAVSLLRQGLSPDQLAAALAKEPATPVLTSTLSAADEYQQLLDQLSSGSSSGIDAYWTAGPVSYRTSSAGVLAPAPVTNPNSVWASSISVQAGGADFEAVPLDDSDVAFRELHEYLGSNAVGSILPTLNPVGEFDPSKLPGFSSLSQVPLETYYPPTAMGANVASKAALEGQSLLPDANIAGYLQEPPLMLTTLSSISAFAHEFPSGDWSAPISSIRVRVSGLHGTIQAQLAQVANVAAAIRNATGLQVDITAGSSPTTQTIALPAGKYGQPALLLDENWVKKRVSLVIVAALDQKSVALFALILVVTALFLVNGSVAAVRGRRREIGVLRCTGWPRHSVFRLIIGELLLLGAVAGLVGTAISSAVILGFQLQMPLWRVGLIMPVAVLLAGLAGLIPAWLATRGDPLDAVQPAVVAPRRRARPVQRLLSLAWSNLRRRPARAALAATALSVGIAALTVLLGIDLAFSQQVTGSLLGSFVSGEVRGVDYLSASLAVALGAASVADVLYLNLRERAAELAALSATGWRRRHLTRLALYEGAGIGVLGSLAGGLVGLAGAWALGGAPLALLGAAVLSIAVGVTLTVVASWVVVTGISRRPVSAAVADE